MKNLDMNTYSLRGEAAELSILAMKFLGMNRTHLMQFLDASGYDVMKLREEAHNVSFMIGVLGFFLQDEELLLNFCEWANIDPTTPKEAHQFLENLQTEAEEE